MRQREANLILANQGWMSSNVKNICYHPQSHWRCWCSWAYSCCGV